MQERLRWEGRVLLAVCVALCSALWGSSAQAFTEEDQQRLCTGDVFRLCSSEIPNRERIIVCMMHKRAQLSDGCRSVFGKPTQAASASGGNRWNSGDRWNNSDRWNNGDRDRWNSGDRW